jgi:cyclophilin family peptidyl-prolyl cis-trans isomerase
MTIDTTQAYAADLVTDSGTIHVQLFASESPRTVNNFVFLARQHFYDGTIFHRVIQNFMIQGGDPTGTGMGGPGYTFADELPPKHPYASGIVCMANAGPNTNGSQFFICSGDGCASLPPSYTEFGMVTTGAEVVTAIAAAPVGPSGSGEMSAPKQPVHVRSVTITGP